MNQNHPNPEMRIKAKIASLYKRLDDWQAEQDCPYVTPPLPKYEHTKQKWSETAEYIFGKLSVFRFLP